MPLPILALVGVCLGNATTAVAQTAPVAAVDSVHIYDKVDQMPAFPGGELELKKFVGRNLRYTAPALKNRVEGNVLIKCVINADGRVTDPVVEKGIGYGCDEEALRVVRTLPAFIPGKQNGIPVAAYYIVPVRFAIKYSD